MPGWCKAGVSVGFSQRYPGVSWGIRGYPGCGRTGTPEKHVGKQALRSNWQGYPVLVLRLNIILKGISEGSAPIFLGSAPIGISRILRDLFPPVKETKSAQLPPPRPKTDLSPSRCIFLWADQPIKKLALRSPEGRRASCMKAEASAIKILDSQRCRVSQLACSLF